MIVLSNLGAAAHGARIIVVGRDKDGLALVFIASHPVHSLIPWFEVENERLGLVTYVASPDRQEPYVAGFEQLRAVDTGFDMSPEVNA